MVKSDSRTSKSIKNSSVALLFYFINLILQFFSRKIFLDYFGAEVMGRNWEWDRPLLMIWHRRAYTASISLKMCSGNISIVWCLATKVISAPRFRRIFLRSQMYRNRILPTQRKSHDDTQLCKANLRTFYPHNWENSCDDIHAICQFHQQVIIYDLSVSTHFRACFLLVFTVGLFGSLTRIKR